MGYLVGARFRLTLSVLWPLLVVRVVAGNVPKADEADPIAAELQRAKDDYLRVVQAAGKELVGNFDSRIKDIMREKRGSEVERAQRVEQHREVLNLFRVSGLLPSETALPKRDLVKLKTPLTRYTKDVASAAGGCKRAYKKAIKEYDKAGDPEAVLRLHREQPAFLGPPGGLVHENRPWVPLFNGRDKSGWVSRGRANWEVIEVAGEGRVLEGSGAGGDLHLDLAQFPGLPNELADFHLRVFVRINDGGNSGLFGRTQDGDVLRSYEAQINSSGKDEHKTGSLIVLNHRESKIPVSTQQRLHEPEQWFLMDFVATGNRLTVAVNGEITAFWADEDKHYARGGIALQQHHSGSVVQFKHIELRDLGSL